MWLYSCVLSPAGDYEELCPGGPGFRPNTVTVILEGNYDNGHSPDKYLRRRTKSHDTFTNKITVISLIVLQDLKDVLARLPLPYQESNFPTNLYLNY